MIRIFGITILACSLAPCTVFSQGGETGQSKAEQVTVSFADPIPKDAVVRIQNQDKKDVPFDTTFLKAKSGRIADVGFATTIIYSDALLVSPFKEVAGNAMVLATHAYDRISVPDMLETEHMKSISKRIGVPNDVAVIFETSPAKPDGKQRIRVMTVIRKANMRLVHIRPEIWRLEGENWVLEDKGAVASMSL